MDFSATDHSSASPERIVSRFVDAINAGDVGGLYELMAEDHLFIDSDGSEVSGRDTVREGWAGFFAMMPDYRVEVQSVFSRQETVVLIGVATGTYSPDGSVEHEHSWRVPAAWRAVVKGGLVAVWQVFVNPEPINRAMRRHGGERV